MNRIESWQSTGPRQTEVCPAAETAYRLPQLLADLEAARMAQDSSSRARVAGELAAYFLRTGDLIQAQQYQQLAISAALDFADDTHAEALSLHDVHESDFAPHSRFEEAALWLIPSASTSEDDWQAFETEIERSCQQQQLPEACEQLELGSRILELAGEPGRAQRYRILQQRLRRCLAVQSGEPRWN